MKGAGIGPAERSGGRLVTIDPIARRFRLDGCDGGSAETTFHYNGAKEDRGRRPKAFSEFTRQRVQNTRRQRKESNLFLGSADGFVPALLPDWLARGRGSHSPVRKPAANLSSCRFCWGKRGNS